ncbi:MULTISPECIES: GDSL-type esterase/lipase family protein [Bacteroides]|uniref:Starch-binding protein n=1 Tax=Bacteroides acidifaciens TaxID=85831 RepID=A0A7K3MEZ3_9BACE|nr:MULTISPECIES: GDSL-type esterase/lipase family protein [Bacteroides]MBF0728933.1 starch-binding protein [Bacteroides acidifaciens]MBF0837072.1 starch-binding protein [Bacteroides acidifaciens]NDO52973.1 starch-binding protein [Bacteroides acidifaciens]TFU51412.1 starch-binding protein [Bacteroides acidifaciens]
MKKYMLLVFALFGMLAIGSCNDDEPVVPPSPGEEIEIPEPATPVLVQTLYFDFGSQTDGRGSMTEGPDANNHYWNNITNNDGNYAAINTVYSSLVNSENTSVTYELTLNSRFSTNGQSGGGGLLEPQEELLKDFAVASATEDYFFIESGENNSSFTFSNLDPKKAYKFYAFGSRSTTQTRTAYYTMTGLNLYQGELQTSGTNCGGEGINQNIQNICESELIYPDDAGNIKFTVSRKNGDYIALNVLKVEEYTDIERPEQFTSLTMSGSAVEEGQVSMHMVSADGSPTNVFEAYTSFGSGDFLFKGITKDGKTVNIGKGYKEGVVATNNYSIAAPVTGQIRLTIDLSSKTYEITPIESWTLVGSVTPNGWTVDKGVPLAYQGKGVWGGRVKLTGISGVSDRERFNFVMNRSWDYVMKRVKGTTNEVGMGTQGYNTEDINLNHGTYHITLDLRRYVYYIDCGEEGIDPFKISVMGSSVANGQGATNNHGYAYMYGELLDERFCNQESKFPWYTSGIAVNGNNTLNLLARYNDLIHDCGTYVIFGLSLGNEGIHNAVDQQAVYNQFRDNMQTLIQKAREDGKYPVMMNNYTRGDFDASDYEYVKQMNLLIHEWDLPSVNLLGAIDNGSGAWANGYQNGDDIYHPTTDGHREFTYAMVPSLFDAIDAGKKQPVRVIGTSYSLANKRVLEFTPEETVHPFTISFKVKGTADGIIASFANGGNATGTLKIQDGVVVYDSPLTGEIKGTVNVTDNQWHVVSLTHYYAQGRTLLYTDKALAGELDEKLTIGKFIVGDNTSTIGREYSELFFYRSAMVQEEIDKLCDGRMLKSSLEIYAPLDGSKSTIENLAQSMNSVTLKTE